MNEVALRGVIRNITLEKRDLMAQRGERLEQSAPDGGMAIAPGRGDGEAENRELHRDALTTCGKNEFTANFACCAESNAIGVSHALRRTRRHRPGRRAS